MTATIQSPVLVRKGDALSVTDIQNDFLPGGALGVSGGDEVIPLTNRVIALFRNAGLPIFITRDWHPAHHSSFKEKNGPWPPHCVQDTKGAEFAAGLTVPEKAVIISKGSDPAHDQYSTLQGRAPSGQTEDELLKSFGITRLFICGLATEYCVLNSVKDAREAGYEVYVMTDAIRAVNVTPGDGAQALEEMVRLGALLITSERLSASS